MLYMSRYGQVYDTSLDESVDTDDLSSMYPVVSMLAQRTYRKVDYTCVSS